LPNDKNRVPLVMPNSTKNFQEYFFPLGGDESFDITTDERVVEGAKNIKFEIDFSEIVYYWNKKNNKKWRFSVATSVPYDSGDIEKNYSKRKDSGFTQTKKDWRSIQGYMYVYLAGINGSKDNIVFIGCGGGKEGKCTNFQYRVEIAHTGKYRFAKVASPGRVSYANPDTGKTGAAGIAGWATSADIGSLNNRWLGMMFICVVKTINNVECRVLRLYIDRHNNNFWKFVAEFIDRGGWGSDMKICKADVKDEIGTWGGPLVTFGGDNLKDGKDGLRYKLITVLEVDPLGNFIDPAPGQGGPPTPKPLPPAGKIYRDVGFAWNLGTTADLCGFPEVPPLVNFYHVAKGGSHSNLRDIRTRCTTKAVTPASLLVGHKPKRVAWWLRKQNNPEGNISCVLRKGSDDTVAVTYEIKSIGGNVRTTPLLAEELTTSDQECIFENLDANYTIVPGDRMSIEYSSGSQANQVEVSRQTDDPFDGPNTCSCKFDSGGIPPAAYSPDDVLDDYSGDMWE
jgi:hypothetical protein